MSSTTATPARRVSRTEAIAIAQQLLRALGNHALPVSGTLDAGTRGALVTFQRAHHLTVNGEVDRETVTALRAAVDGHPEPHVHHHHPHPHTHTHGTLTPAQRIEARKLVLKGCQEMLARAGHVLYTEGSERWSAIAGRRRFLDGEYAEAADCSSMVTWLLWNVFTHFDPDFPDIVNGANWTAGYTGTIAQHGTLITSDADIEIGDLVLYGPPPTFNHVTMAIGNSRVFSFGGPGGPFNEEIDYWRQMPGPYPGRRAETRRFI